MIIELSKRGLVTSLTIMLFFAATLLVHHIRSNSSLVHDVRIDSLPLQLGQWTGREAPEMDMHARETLQLSRYIRRHYQHPSGREVYLYVGYWDKQTGDHQAAKHSPMLCLPANGWKISPPAEYSTQDIPNIPVLKLSSLVGQQRGSSELFYYWFFAGEKVYREESHALLNMTLQTLLHGRSDGGIIEISTMLRPGPNQQEIISEGKETMSLFLQDFLPAIQNIIEERRVSSKTSKLEL